MECCNKESVKNFLCDFISTFAGRMNLTLDIGNTLMKLGWFNDDKLVKKISHYDISVRTISELRNVNKKIDNVIVSDVRDDGRKIRGAFKGIPNLISLNHKTPLPFKNSYATPSTLGTDRISLVAGALKYFPRKNVLVISAGTCVTYDFINIKHEYKGGSISPGL